MNQVCCSAREVLDTRYKDIKDRRERGVVIYGFANTLQGLITQKVEGFEVINPVLSGKIIEVEHHVINTQKHGKGLEGCICRIKKLSVPELKDALKSATRDDLYLFVTMLNPRIMHRPISDFVEERNIIVERVSQIEQSLISEYGEDSCEVSDFRKDMEKFQYIYNTVACSKYKSRDSFCYDPDPDFSEEDEIRWKWEGLNKEENKEDGGYIMN